MLHETKAFLTDLLGAQFTAALAKIYFTLIAPVLAQPTLHWLFISTAILVAWLYFITREAVPGRRSLVTFFRYLFPREIYSHPSAIVDYKFYVVMQIVMANLRVGQWVAGLASVLLVGEGIRWLLDQLFGAPTQPGSPTLLVMVLFTVCMTLAYDFARFVVHYLHHRIPILWEFHKVHHAAEVLTPITGYRSHPVDQAIEFLFRLVGTAAVTGGFAHFYPQGMAELTILNYSAITFFYFLTSLLRHSHVAVGFGPVSKWLVSPVMHQLHHSNDPRHFDRNFGFIFSIWDRMAGTLVVPKAGEKFNLGLPRDAGKFDTVSALFFHPFVAAARLLIPKSPVRPAP